MPTCWPRSSKAAGRWPRTTGPGGAGQEHGYRGYTSYASLNDLPIRDPVFADLKKKLDRHVARFAEECAFDLGGRKLKLDSLWVNVLKPGGHHSAHIHPHSVVSGTLYVAMPKGSGALKLEDPRLPMLMAAPAGAPMRRTIWRPSPPPRPNRARCCSGKAGCGMRWCPTPRRASGSASASIITDPNETGATTRTAPATSRKVPRLVAHERRLVAAISCR